MQTTNIGHFGGFGNFGFSLGAAVSPDIQRLQQALLLLATASKDLGKYPSMQYPNPASPGTLLKIDGQTGPTTAAAAARAFTRHIGSFQAGGFTAAQMTPTFVAANALKIAAIVEAEVARRQAAAAGVPAAIATTTPSVTPMLAPIPMTPVAPVAPVTTAPAAAAPKKSADIQRLQTALLALGAQRKDTASKYPSMLWPRPGMSKPFSADSETGPTTAAAAQRAFTNHIGSGQAGGFTAGQMTPDFIAANAARIAAVVEAEVARFAVTPSAPTGPAAAAALPATPAVLVKAPSKSPEIGRLQTALLALGTQRKDMASKYPSMLWPRSGMSKPFSADTETGPTTAAAAQRAFTNHIGSFQAGGFTAAQMTADFIALNAAKIAEVVEAEVKRFAVATPGAPVPAALIKAPTTSPEIGRLQAALLALGKATNDLGKYPSMLYPNPDKPGLLFKADNQTGPTTAAAAKRAFGKPHIGPGQAGGFTADQMTPEFIAANAAAIAAVVEAEIARRPAGGGALPPVVGPGGLPATAPAPKESADIEALQKTLIDFGTRIGDKAITMSCAGGKKFTADRKTGTCTANATNRMFTQHIGTFIGGEAVPEAFRTGKLTADDVSRNAVELNRLAAKRLAELAATQPARPVSKEDMAKVNADVRRMQAGVVALAGKANDTALLAMIKAVKVPPGYTDGRMGPTTEKTVNQALSVDALTAPAELRTNSLTQEYIFANAAKIADVLEAEVTSRGGKIQVAVDPRAKKQENADVTRLQLALIALSVGVNDPTLATKGVRGKKGKGDGLIGGETTAAAKLFFTKYAISTTVVPPEIAAGTFNDDYVFVNAAKIAEQVEAAVKERTGKVVVTGDKMLEYNVNVYRLQVALQSLSPVVGDPAFDATIQSLVGGDWADGKMGEKTERAMNLTFPKYVTTAGPEMRTGTVPRELIFANADKLALNVEAELAKRNAPIVDPKKKGKKGKKGTTPEPLITADKRVKKLQRALQSLATAVKDSALNVKASGFMDDVTVQAVNRSIDVHGVVGPSVLPAPEAAAAAGKMPKPGATAGFLGDLADLSEFGEVGFGDFGDAGFGNFADYGATSLGSTSFGYFGRSMLGAASYTAADIGAYLDNFIMAIEAKALEKGGTIQPDPEPATEPGKKKKQTYAPAMEALQQSINAFGEALKNPAVKVEPVDGLTGTTTATAYAVAYLLIKKTPVPPEFKKSLTPREIRKNAVALTKLFDAEISALGKTPPKHPKGSDVQADDSCTVNCDVAPKQETKTDPVTGKTETVTTNPATGAATTITTTGGGGTGGGGGTITATTDPATGQTTTATTTTDPVTGEQKTEQKTEPAKAEDLQKTEPPIVPPEPAKRPAWFWPAIIGGSALVLGGVGFYIYKKRKAKAGGAPLPAKSKTKGGFGPMKSSRPAMAGWRYR